MVFAIVKVPPGTDLNVDRHIETTDEEDSNMIWLAEKEPNFINLTRPGYGTRQEYKNGSAYVKTSENLEFITPWCLLNSPLLDEVRGWKF